MPDSNVDEQKISKIIFFLNARIDFKPEVGIILGTGLGNLIDKMEITLKIPYEEIDHFPRSTVQSHDGKLLFGHLRNRRVIVFSGRFHYYEGYDMQDVTLPVRIMQSLGVSKMIVSNAAGGLNPDFRAGEIVLIQDHINMLPANPLRGKNLPSFGLRFPDMMHAYSPSLLQLAEQSAKKLNIPVKRGVYLGLQGPNLETPAEYNAFHLLGADLIGMSTIPEVIVARHADIEVLAFSIVSNVCFPLEQIKVTTIESVIETVKRSGYNLSLLIEEVLIDLT